MNVFYDYLFYFLIYGFFGWCLEVFYHAVEKGEWTNRGFLNGAICPIYGIGIVVVFWILRPISDFGPLLFVGGVLLCTMIELVTGVLLEKIFHQRWWDYSHDRFNFKGYVCLKFSLYWGIAAVFVVKLIHPTIEAFVAWIPHTLGIIFLIVAMGILLVDVVDTFHTVIGINRDLQRVHEGATAIRKASDELSERIFEGTMRAKEEGEEVGLQLALGKAELETRAAETRKNLDDTVVAIALGLKKRQQRLFRVFPDLKSTRYEADLEMVKEVIEKYLPLNRRKEKF